MFKLWFPEAASIVAQKIDDLFFFSTAWTASTGLLVLLILFTFLIIYRRRKGHTSYYTHGTSRGALTLTLILAALVFVALDVNLAYHDHKVWQAMFGQPPSPSEALRVEIMPQQFAWNIRYAGPDGEFGTADDIVTMNELHVPVGKPVIVQLSSKDVIHSFFLPELRIKQDAVPGMVTSIYFQPTVTGHFNIACAQHCGLGHYRMKGEFFVDAPADYDAWMLASSKDQAASEPWAWDWRS